MSAAEIRQQIADIAKDTSKCYNGTALFYLLNHTVQKGRKQTVAYSRVVNVLTESFPTPGAQVSHTRLHKKLRCVHEVYKKLMKTPERNRESVLHFLSEVLDLGSLTISANSPAISTPECTEPHVSPLAAIEENKIPAVSTPVKTRQDCGSCSSKKKLNFSLKKSIGEEKRRAFRLKKSTANLKKELNVRATKQKVKRHQEKIQELKIFIKNYEIKLNYSEKNRKKFETRCDDISKANIQLISENSDLKRQLEKLTKECQDLKHSQKKLAAELTQSHRYCEDLEVRIKDSEERSKEQEETLISKKGKHYNADIRRAVYHQLVCDVPVRHCGHLIAVFVEIFCGKWLKDIPSASTSAQMAYELGVLTNIQLMEFMLSQKEKLILSWDATTIDGRHVNEIHLTVNKVNCLMLDVRHLAGGKTADYVSHIVSALTEAATTYAKFTQQSQAEIFTALKSSISATLTDRAVVNTCVTQQLCVELDAELVQLHCNVHPLDSTARASKQGLIKVDETYQVPGHCYGSEGRAANLINAISVLRFKDGTGDPVGFKNFLHQHNLPAGTFVRYVGNRIHVLYHLAGVLILHETKLKEFIETECTACGLLRSRILKDLTNSKIMVQVWALAVTGKVFTGPWMTKFYSSHMSNLEMQCVQALTMWTQETSLRQPTHNVFGEPLSPEEDDVVAALQSYTTSELDIQEEALSACLKACLSVLQRQLDSFITGLEPSPDVMAKTASAPTHNMSSECNLGCLDKMWRRAPLATAGFLSGKVRSKMNKCTAWLDSKDPQEREQLIRFAVTEAADERVKQCILEKSVFEDIARRRKEVASERKKQLRNSKMRQVDQCLKSRSVAELDCSPAVKEKLALFCETPESLLGVILLHIVDSSEFYARVHDILPKNELMLGYWRLEESESASVDHKIAVSAFFADAIIGCLMFL